MDIYILAHSFLSKKNIYHFLYISATCRIYLICYSKSKFKNKFSPQPLHWNIHNILANIVGCHLYVYPKSWFCAISSSMHSWKVLNTVVSKKVRPSAAVPFFLDTNIFGPFLVFFLVIAKKSRYTSILKGFRGNYWVIF